ncbi:MAG: hypothetical protein ACXU8A_13200 [Burkholderiaceae bacterium]
MARLLADGVAAYVDSVAKTINSHAYLIVCKEKGRLVQNHDHKKYTLSWDLSPARKFQLIGFTHQEERKDIDQLANLK